MNTDSRHLCRFGPMTHCNHEILPCSVFGDICRASTLHLCRLEKALLFLQLDHEQITVIHETKLGEKLLTLCEDDDVETAAMALKCISLLLENVFRNNVVEFEETMMNLRLGRWCVDRLCNAEKLDSLVLSELWILTASVVKVSRRERDLVVSLFVLSHLDMLSTHTKEMFHIVRNATLHECHSADMRSLLYEILTALRDTAVLDMCTYGWLLDVVNNYLFDKEENIDICIEFGFHTAVWNNILSTRRVTESEAEFISSFVNFDLCSGISWLLFCSKLINEDNCLFLLSGLLKAAGKCFPDQKEPAELNEIQCLYMELLKDLTLSSISLIEFMKFQQRTSLVVFIAWMF